MLSVPSTTVLWSFLLTLVNTAVQVSMAAALSDANKSCFLCLYQGIISVLDPRSLEQESRTSKYALVFPLKVSGYTLQYVLLHESDEMRAKKLCDVWARHCWINMAKEFPMMFNGFGCCACALRHNTGPNASKVFLIWKIIIKLSLFFVFFCVYSF